MNDQENMYFRCRKEAALHDDRLSSREKASELLGISPSQLANYELGITKSVPVDSVVLMADLYKAPKLKARYCAESCPIGAERPTCTQRRSDRRRQHRLGRDQLHRGGAGRRADSQEHPGHHRPAAGRL